MKVVVDNKEVLKAKTHKLRNDFAVYSLQGLPGNRNRARKGREALGLSHLKAWADDTVYTLRQHFGHLLRNQYVGSQRVMRAVYLTGPRRKDNRFCCFASLCELTP